MSNVTNMTISIAFRAIKFTFHTPFNVTPLQDFTPYRPGPKYPLMIIWEDMTIPKGNILIFNKLLIRFTAKS